MPKIDNERDMTISFKSLQGFTKKIYVKNKLHFFYITI